MAEIIIGILMILTFIGMIIYCVKGHNLMVGFFTMATIWTVMALIGNAISPSPAMEDENLLSVLKNVYQTGPEGYASSILVNIFFGAFFGRVLVDTGIAATLIRKVVELGGDRPRITMVLLCIVTSLCFTSMTGIGPVISIAVIVMPILQALGIPSAIALFAFMGSIMAGICANITNFTQYQGILGGIEPAFLQQYDYNAYFLFGAIAMVVCLIVVLIVASLALNKEKVTHAWAAVSSNGKEETAPWYSWISVILPVVLVVTTKCPIILAFIASALYALLTCGKLRQKFSGICRMLAKQFADGAVDVAPMIGFLLTLAMFNNAATYAAPYFKAVIGGIFPTTAFGIAALFAVLVPLGFFRGPTNLVGCGTAIAAVVLSLAKWPVAFIYPLFAVTTIVPQHLDITQSWVAWGLGYSKVSSRDFMKYSIPTGWIAGAILCFVAFFLYGNLV
ncbi:citrate transporter [Eubacteriales bacterium mix99]